MTTIETTAPLDRRRREAPHDHAHERKRATKPADTSFATLTTTQGVGEPGSWLHSKIARRSPTPNGPLLGSSNQ